MKTEPGTPGGTHAVRIDLALLLLRVILAAVFGTYGYLKWAGGMNRFVALLMTANLPVPEAAARFVASLELGGAILLLVGLGSRLVGALLAVEMAVAFGRVDWPRGFVGGYDFDLTLMTVALCLAIAGGGGFSIGRDRLSR